MSDGGARDQGTVCPKVCTGARDKLINIYDIAPERIDCADPKWIGDCNHCTELFKSVFQVMMFDPTLCGDH